MRAKGERVSRRFIEFFTVYFAIASRNRHECWFARAAEATAPYFTQQHDT
jgi:hypothetical protein